MRNRIVETLAYVHDSAVMVAGFSPTKRQEAEKYLRAESREIPGSVFTINEVIGPSLQVGESNRTVSERTFLGRQGAQSEIENLIHQDPSIRNWYRD